MFPVLFSLGPVTITSYGVLAVLAFFLGAFVVWKKGREEHFEEEELFDVTLLATFWGLVVARIGYIALYWSEFEWNILKWVTLVRNPGLSTEGFILGGLVVVVVFARSKKWLVWNILDVAALGAVVASVWMYLAAFLNGSGYGVRTSLPWGISFPGVEGPRHPTQMYGLLLSVVLVWLLHKIFAQYRTYDWYKGNANEAVGGLVACVYLVGLGLLFLIMGWLQPGDRMRIWLGLFGVIAGLGLGYMRSGRVLREDGENIWQRMRRREVTPEPVRQRKRKRHGIVAGVDVK